MMKWIMEEKEQFIYIVKCNANVCQTKLFNLICKRDERC